MPIDPALLTGTAAATLVLAYIVKQLWDAHKESDADVRTQRDVATAGWTAQTDATRQQAAATNRLADLLERDRAKP